MTTVRSTIGLIFVVILALMGAAAMMFAVEGRTEELDHAKLVIEIQADAVDSCRQTIDSMRRTIEALRTQTARHDK